MALCKTLGTPLLTHWSYYSLAINHRYHTLSWDLGCHKSLISAVRSKFDQRVESTAVFNTLKPTQNCRHSADILKCIFLNDSVWIPLKTSLKFVPEVRINNIPSLVQIMAWRRPGDKLLSALRMLGLLKHICDPRRPQWFNSLRPSDAYMRQWSNQHWFR